MSIPLDRLYHFINNIANEIYGDATVIIRPYPYGSKKIEDLTSLLYTPPDNFVSGFHVYCHDQEPLDYNEMLCAQSECKLIPFQILRNSLTPPTESFPNIRRYANINSLALLLHSEKRSSNLIQYQENTFIPVYYWNHAIVALDWFRFARHEKFTKNVKKIFLIYNRAWSGTREYRLKFIDLLIDQQLIDRCQTSVNVIEPELGIHYSQHRFKNPQWQPAHLLENHSTVNPTASYASADFDTTDYESTDIEVILETLFDDDRLHLTEKSLRPIACGQPFILAGTQGSLEYLREYGFKTYNTVWDEEYDLIDNSKKRMEAIVDLMQSIVAWTPEIRAQKMHNAQIIADYNRQYFFSDTFFNYVIAELRDNFKSAFDIFNTENTCQHYVNRWKILLANQEIVDFLRNNNDSSFLSLDEIKNTLRIAEQKS
jgi:hypothetical protein